MFFKYLALCTITLLAFASLLDAGHTHRHHHRRPRTPGALPALVKRQAVASSVEIPITNFNLLKSEFAAFGTWMKSFFSTEMDATKFNEEVQGHLDFIDSWLDAATSGSEPAPTALSNPVALQRRAGSESIEVSLAQLQLLRSETVEFKSWIGTGNTTNKDHLQLEVQTYESWVSAWLASTDGSSPSGASGPTTLSANPTAVAVPEQPANPAISPPSSSSSWSSPNIPESSPAPKVSSWSSSSVQAAPVSTAAPEVLSWSSSSVQAAQVSSPAPVTISSPSSSVQAAPVSSPAPEVLSSSSTFVQAGPVSSPAPNARTSGPGGSFNAAANDNVAVYYGATPATARHSLGQVCQQPSVNIVILAFLTAFHDGTGYPVVNFGVACAEQTPAMASKATGLLQCTQLAADIKKCQGLGKKVLLSLGGAVASTQFATSSEATKVADMLWDLFGGGTNQILDLRPFGDVKLDGFDVDNENKQPQYYTDFVTQLRSNMDKDNTKPYYISAAPQCPIPDGSIPLEAMAQMDFVWVQFYNNGVCNIDQPGFQESFLAWSKNLAGGPKLYIGAPACPTCAKSGYPDPAKIQLAISGAKGAGVPNFGGVMLWDGSWAVENMAGGKDYIMVVKEALA